MTAATCRRCRGQEADDTGVPCARCDGYGIEPVFPPEGPEPGRDYIEWAAARVREANAARDTYTRHHDHACWTVHLDCANARIAHLEARIMELAAQLHLAYNPPLDGGPAWDR